MANLKERLLGLIDNGASRAMDMFDTMNETINSIDWNAQFNSLMDMKDALMEKSNELLGEFNELMKQVKNNISDYEVTVPFDESIGEKFKHKVDGNKLTVEVTFSDETSERCNKTTVMIPENCDVEKLSTKHDAIKKTMTIVIPKNIVEPKSEEEKKSEGFKLSRMATPKKTEEEPHEAESKLLKKFHENVRKGTRVTRPTVTPRGANGRFIKRTPNN